METYKIVRFYKNGGPSYCKPGLPRGLTLEEARAYCSSSESSSKTCITTSNVRRTKRYGEWFLGFTSESK